MPGSDNFFTIEKLKELVKFYQEDKNGKRSPAESHKSANAILVMECGVAGTGHIPDIEPRLTGIEPGSPVFFSREYFNDYDDLAIAVNNADGEKIGYIPRRKNEAIARLMDAGKDFCGEVMDIWYPESDNWVNIIIRIYLCNP